MSLSIKKILIASIIAPLLLVLISQVLQTNSEHKILENKKTVYNMATKFLSDVYDLNVDDAYSQLESRSEILEKYSGYISKEEWGERIELDFSHLTLNKILKPLSYSEISYVLNYDKPKETYLVEFSLDVNFEKTKEKRTGVLEYVKTDDVFKIHSFEIDVSSDPEKGRWVLY